MRSSGVGRRPEKRVDHHMQTTGGACESVIEGEYNTLLTRNESRLCAHGIRNMDDPEDQQIERERERGNGSDGRWG